MQLEGGTHTYLVQHLTLKVAHTQKHFAPYSLSVTIRYVQERLSESET